MSDEKVERIGFGDRFMDGDGEEWRYSDEDRDGNVILQTVNRHGPSAYYARTTYEEAIAMRQKAIDVGVTRSCSVLQQWIRDLQKEMKKVKDELNKMKKDKVKKTKAPIKAD